MHDFPLDLSFGYEDKAIFSEMQIVSENMHNHFSYFLPLIFRAYGTFAAN